MFHITLPSKRERGGGAAIGISLNPWNNSRRGRHSPVEPILLDLSGPILPGLWTTGLEFFDKHNQSNPWWIMSPSLKDIKIDVLDYINAI